MVDTRDKRFSLVSLGLWRGRVLPNPSGGFSDAGRRSQLALLYAMAGEPPPPFNIAWSRNANKVVGWRIQQV